VRQLDPHMRIIAALDVPSVAEARVLAGQLAGHVGLAKVGLELFVAEGAEAVRAVQDAGLPVFLDLKLHDIPNTVEGAARSVARLGVQMLTVHASGGRAMISAAKRGLSASTGEPAKLLAVTVLTSLAPADLAEQQISGTLEEHVVRLATMAIDAGADGLVCSPHEVAAIRKAVGMQPILVVPGIRPAGSQAHDQARAATPASAIAAGADYLVVGRPLREGSSPAEAAKRIALEIAGIS
jgi:orotidine-5'-phosphate decarboxylase